LDPLHIKINCAIFSLKRKHISVQKHCLPVLKRENLSRRLKISWQLWHLTGKYAKYIADFYANRKI